MTQRQPIPHHVNPPNNPPGQPIARAPYNFVPLPQAIFEVATVRAKDNGTALELQCDPRFEVELDGQRRPVWQCHDHFAPGTHSGWIDLTIEALTPIFIRGAARQRNGQWDHRDSRVRPEPFLDHLGRPTIPGSSLRGMIRNVVEILSYSKIQPVSNRRPFFRTVADDRIGRRYRGLLMPRGTKPSGGFAERRGDDWVIVPANEVLRIPHAIAPDHFHYRQHPNYHPNWQWQNAECWFRRGDGSNVSSIEFTHPNHGSWEHGVVILTGSAPKKKAEFVFVGRDDSRAIGIPAELVERFHDDDQITAWQEQAFPVDRPQQRSRHRCGHLRHGEPVFYVCDDAGQLLFFGRAQMFRFPYDRTPAELVARHLRSAEQPEGGQSTDGAEIEPGTAGLDLAEAIFGRVQADPRPGFTDPLPTIKGRVFFEDCTVTAPGKWLEEEIVPKILASPKVTAYQQYLTQDGQKSSNEHTTYLANDLTTIRGHKLYWHGWEPTAGINQVKEEPAATHQNLHSDRPHDTQHTLAQPVRSQATFTGRIRFENLTDIELGALLCALNLPAGCAHKIGMGKPLGLGSIRIDAQLNLVNHSARYRQWIDDGTTIAAPAPFVEAFTKAMVNHGQGAGEAMLTKYPPSDLHRLARLDALFTILRWNDQPGPSETRYMKIEGGDPALYPKDKQGKVNEFRTRPVLPTPHAIVGGRGPRWGTDEPNWPRPPPEPAATSAPAAHGKKETSTSRKTAGASANKPHELEKDRSYQAIVHGTKKRRLEVYIELANDRDAFGMVENSEEVPEFLRSPGTRINVLVVQLSTTARVFRFVPDV